MSSLLTAWPLERSEPQTVGLCPHRLRHVGELIRRYLDEGRVAGVIALAARRGRIAHLECFGCMDMENRRAMREDAIFRLYSMTKIVTSVAVLMLMEEGRFLLDEPVSRILPELKHLRVSCKGADGEEELLRPRREVTIHDLLTHTAGMTYDLFFEAHDKGMTLKAFVEELGRRPLQHHPGEVWDYSVATDVLGRLIEVVSGITLGEFFQKKIFAPLGMTDTAFWVPAEKADRLAALYKADDAGRLVVVDELSPDPAVAGRLFLQPPALESGGGGLVGTTSDYLRFALMLLNKGALGDTRLLGRKTVELMTADHLPAGHRPLENNRGFGLGVSVARQLGELRQVGSVGEFGWAGAARTQVWIDPAEELVTMILLQLLPKGMFPLMDLFKQSVYQAIVR